MSREDTGNGEDWHRHPRPALDGGACAAGPGPLPAVGRGAAALHLAVASVDLPHGVRHQDRPVLLALQSLQFGVPLQPDVVTAEWDRDAGDAREAGSENRAPLTSQCQVPFFCGILFQ